MAYAAGWNGTFPHFNNTHKNTQEPIYTNLFEVQYICVDLSKEESDFLTECTHKINKNTLCIHVNEDEDGGIEVMRTLKKMKKFTLNVLLHNRNGENIALVIFRNCKFVDLVVDFCDLAWGEDDILKPEFRFDCEESEYVDSSEIKNYERRVKLERIIKP